ncbi:MAG: hypothetical protein APF81_21715 [Desulfosporosinus sp. BRH_c37]|nr:MAG: hypothetical protein APF81_21715 [Desulfosporosinus sp. BRH_c37]
MVISLEQLGIEVVEVEPDFFKEMKPGDEKAVAPNDENVVVSRMEKRIGKRRIPMVISVLKSISIDATLIYNEVSEERFQL